MSARPDVTARGARGDAAELPNGETSFGTRNGASTPGSQAPALSQRLDSCAIVLWRGYRYFEFCAVAADGTLLKRSSGFPRRRAREPAESERSRAAHAALAEQLAQEGWEPQAEGRAWYETRFVRPARGGPALAHTAALTAQGPDGVSERTSSRLRPVDGGPPAANVSAALVPTRASLVVSETVLLVHPPARRLEEAAPDARAPARRTRYLDERRARRGQVLALVTLPVGIALCVWLVHGGGLARGRRAAAAVRPAKARPPPSYPARF
jgi:hypothetical protein